ncbi:unnamed protein product [Diamesa tonsa]
MMSFKRNSSTIASVLRYSDFGDPVKVVKMCQEQLKSPGTNQLLVKILLSPINPADINTIQGKYPVKPEFPAVPGNECVAEVVSIGSGVSQFKNGDLVVPFSTGLGTWRTHGIFDETELMKVPKGIPLPEAASITVNPCTAYRMIKDFEELKVNDTVIHNGANSACGQSIIQICKALNLNNVGIVRDRPDIAELTVYLKSLGATEILTEEQCRTTKIFKSGEITKPKLALNCVGGKNALEMCRHLADHGTMVTYGGMSREPVLVPTSSLIFKDLKFRGFWMTRWKEQMSQKPLNKEMFDDLFKFIAEGKLKAPKHEIIQYETFEEALASSLSLKGFAGNKIMLKFNE